MNKQRVLVLHRGGVNGVRGTEICVVQSVEALSKAGYDVIVARNLSVFDHLINQSSSQIIQFDFPEVFVNWFSTRFPIVVWYKQFKKLSALVRGLRPTLIYCSGGLPCQLGVSVGKRYDVPVLCHFHHPAERVYYLSWLIRYADHHVFPSEFTKQDVYQKTGADGDVVYNGINTDAFSSVYRKDSAWREKLGIPADAIVIGQVGALTANKRPEFLLGAYQRALAEVPNLHLCIVGKGPIEAELKNQIQARGLSERVTVTGYVESVLPYYQHVLDINILASSEEGLGISILEGAACSLPSIATDCTGLRECTIDGVTGIRFPLNSEDQLVRAIVELALDQVKRESMGNEGRKYVLTRFTSQHYQDGILSAVARTAKAAKAALDSRLV